MLDNFIVLGYLIVILSIGIYYRSHSGTFKSFATVKDSSRKNRLLLVATIFASSVGGGTTFGLSEKSFMGNLAYTYGLLLTIPIDLLIAVYLVPRIIKHYGVESVGDILSKYYGQIGRIISGSAAIIVSIGLVAAQISVSGRIFQYILEVDYQKGVILSYGIVIVYTTIGGLRSVMFTNLLQFFAMITSIPIITIVGIKTIGIGNFINEIPTEKISFTNYDLVNNTISAALGFAVMGLYPNFIQRALINNNPSETKQAIYIKSAIYAVFLVLITCNGLLAHQLYPEQLSSIALPHLIDQIIPVGLKGLVVVGLLAAVMSTADSDLNVTSISLVKDLFSPIFKEHNQQKLLLIARISNVLIGSFAIIIALSFSSVVDLVVFVSGFWAPVILVPLVFLLFEITISIRMMVVCSIAGSSSFLLWEYFVANYISLKGVFIGTITSLVIFLLALCIKKSNIKFISNK